MDELTEKKEKIGRETEQAEGTLRSGAEVAAEIAAQYDAADAQAVSAIDRRVEQETEQLQTNAALEDASLASKYRDATAQQYLRMDNQALTDQIAGRRGGIAEASLSQVQGTYQAQRARIARQQLELASSTAREMEALRAQGEFDKADALLKNSQLRLQALYAEAVRIEERDLAAAQFAEDLARRQQQQEREDAAHRTEQLREQGMLLLQYGVVPPDNMLEAMGIDRASAEQYALAVRQGLIRS